jgi:ABC-type transport system involved in multi-copper enzyme maturation permease subunit
MARFLAQTLAVARLELRKTFFARRGWWVYFLAFAPALLFLVHALYAPRGRERLERIAAAHPVSASALRAIHMGMTPDQVIERVGDPYMRRQGRPRPDGSPGNLTLRYTDGKADVILQFGGGKLHGISRFEAESFERVTIMFATVFQFFFLRLAVFFGCVGVFMNLFRGEMLDKSLHFYLLTPVRREALVAGKYLAGVAASAVIFSASAALQYALMLWPFGRDAIASHMGGGGWGELFSYLGVTALACAAYGGIFLAAGLVFQNPIIPAAVVLVWESVNVFLPAALKKISVIFYLHSLCPVPAEADNGMPPIWKLLMLGSAPQGKTSAILGILALTAVALLLSALRARRLEINYSSD